MQIKEGAENLRKVAKDKKSVSDVNHIVKKSINKLSELQAELQELDSQLLVTQGNLPTSPLVGKYHNYFRVAKKPAKIQKVRPAG